MPLAPDHQLGPYTIVRHLADGGMAEIYLATRIGPSGFTKTCVIKRIKDGLRESPEFRQMFEQEARLVAHLEHPNIVQIFDFESTKAELYLAMHYVEGCSLANLRRDLPYEVVPPFMAARIAVEIAKALAFVHGHAGRDGKSLGLVHRDVSPQNILLSRKGEVKLADFGVAKPSLKQTSGMVKGKAPYMPPEQLEGWKLDARSDLFALGVVLYEMVCGRRPFDGVTELDVGLRLKSGVAADPVTQHNPSVPQALGQVIAKAVQLRPEDRFATGEAFVAALEDVLRLASFADADLGRFLSERISASASALSPANEPTVITEPGATVAGRRKAEAGEGARVIDLPLRAASEEIPFAPAGEPGALRKLAIREPNSMVSVSSTAALDKLTDGDGRIDTGPLRHLPPEPEDVMAMVIGPPVPRVNASLSVRPLRKEIFRLISLPDIDVEFELTMVQRPDLFVRMPRHFEIELLQPGELPQRDNWVILDGDGRQFSAVVDRPHFNSSWGAPQTFTRRWYMDVDHPRDDLRFGMWFVSTASEDLAATWSVFGPDRQDLNGQVGAPVPRVKASLTTRPLEPEVYRLISLPDIDIEFHIARTRLTRYEDPMPRFFEIEPMRPGELPERSNWIVIDGFGNQYAAVVDQPHFYADLGDPATRSRRWFMDVDYSREDPRHGKNGRN